MDDRKKIKDTKLGVWLKAKAPDAFEAVKDALPDSGVLGVVKNLVGGDSEAEALLEELRLQEQKEVTKRWEADMGSDSKFAKVVRPATLVFLTVASFAMAVLDSMGQLQFEVKEPYIDMIQMMAMTAFGAYFAGRSYEKTRRR